MARNELIPIILEVSHCFLTLEEGIYVEIDLTFE
jgi:hypothetical protein